MTDSTSGPRMGERREPSGEHAWVRELLGPCVIGALDP